MCRSLIHKTLNIKNVPYYYKFVEDIVRDVSQRLKADDNITWFSVSAENFESIHSHSAYAHITSDPDQ